MVLLPSLLFIFIITSYLPSVSAQIDDSGVGNALSVPRSTANSSSISDNGDTFTVNGRISSIIFVHQNAANASNTSEKKILSTNSSSDIAISSVNAKKFVLSGNWDMKIVNGTPTDFTAKFIKVLADGNRWHTHEIINFKPANGTRIELKPNNTISFSGKVDVKLNNTRPWNGTNVNVFISKGKTISITLDDKATGDHFQGQPIYGTVESIKDANGNEMLGDQHQLILRLEQ